MTSPAPGADSAPVTVGNRRLGLALLVIATAQLMVVLDATIVNVALPHIQRALGFSGSGLEWVVNAYAVTFGGLLLLGGRAGDILGRRRVFVFGLLLFSAASLLGGFATSQWWLLAARAVQGVGGAVIAPTALALITTNFPEGGERNRAFGVYAAMAGAGSAIRSGIAYLPFAVGVVAASALASPLVARIGARPLILAGAAAVAGGMFWFSRLTEHASYPSQLLGPQLVSSFGLGLVFVPLSLVALHNVAEQDSGVASSLLNAGQQVGGAIGLALLGTVAWTTVADSVRTQVAHAAAAAAKAGRPLPKPGTPPASIYDHALAAGFSRGFVVAAGIALLALLIAIATIRVRRQDLAGPVPEPPTAAPRLAAPQPGTVQPGTVQRAEDRAALAAAVRPCRLC